MFVCVCVCVCVSGLVQDLVWQCSFEAVGWGVFALHEESEEFSFSFHKDGPSPHKSEAILLQDVIAILHHLGETESITPTVKKLQSRVVLSMCRCIMVLF